MEEINFQENSEAGRINDPEIAHEAAKIEKFYRDDTRRTDGKRNIMVGLAKRDGTVMTEKEEQEYIDKMGEELAERYLKLNSELPQDKKESAQQIEQLLDYAKQQVEAILSKLRSLDKKNPLLEGVTVEDVLHDTNGILLRLSDSYYRKLGMTHAQERDTNRLQYLVQGLRDYHELSGPLFKDQLIIIQGSRIDKVEDRLNGLEKNYHYLA